MKSHFYIVLCFLLNVALAVDPFENLARFGPCFEVIESTTCNSSLPQSFQPLNPPAGINDPDTWAFLFTSKNPDRAEPLHLCGGRLPPNTMFDPTLDTEVIIHGFVDGVCRTAWMREMKDQLFQRGKYNVILIDWSWGNTADYGVASKNCKVAGEQTGFVINNILRQTGASAKKFHVIGHSFGAISTGYVGRSVPGLRRITALDPALAPFKNAPPNQRVTYRDAQIVDVIHTNGGNCFPFAVADNRALGHADFYPDGGTVELSCYSDLLKSFIKGDILYGLWSLLPQLCFHLQCLQFYKVSINPKDCQFVGVESTSYRRFLKSNTDRKPWAVMGMDFEYFPRGNNQTRRKYYLKTKLNCPYYDNSYIGQRQYPFNTSCGGGF